MPTLRQLRDRVRSLKNTQQITRAMKMVAGAKIRRAEAAMRAARPYAATISDMLAELVAGPGTIDHPLLRSREQKQRAILVMTADKGLCGAFNSNLVRAALTLARDWGPNTKLYVVGIKGRVQLRRSPFEIATFWPLGAKPFVETGHEIADTLSDHFLSGSVDAVTLVSSRFVSTVMQRPTPMPLLPIAPPGDRKPQRAANKNAFEYEPDAPSVLVALLPKYLQFTIFQALLETQASEFAARLIAMSNATDNAGKLIDDLTLVMNKTRQATITKEILEIAGGAEALRA